MANEAYPLNVNGDGWITGGQAPGTTSANTIGGATVKQDGTADYWLPIWSGEILNAYDQYNIFEPLVTTKSITSGTTMRFPITGTVGMKAQWKAGEELVGSSDISSPEWFDISLDSRPMASHFELDDISLLLTQWEYRSELARQAGLSLANARDKQIACLIAQGAFMNARSPAMSKGGNMATSSANGIVQTADYSDASTYDLEANSVFNYLGHTGPNTTNTTRTNAALLFLEYLERYMIRLQEMDGPTEGVYASVTPQAFQDIRALGIARTAAAIGTGNTTPNSMQPMFGGVADAGGLGAGYRTGMNALSDTLEYMGVTIVKTNHMPKQTVKANDAAAAYGVTVYKTGAAADVAGGEIIVDGTKFADVRKDPSGAAAFTANTSDITVGNDAQFIVRDLGDSKYDFDWNVFNKSGATDADSLDAMFPVQALIWQKEAVASLNLQGMKVDTVADVRRNTQFTVASKMSGGGILRPELCAVVCGLEKGIA